VTTDAGDLWCVWVPLGTRGLLDQDTEIATPDRKTALLFAASLGGSPERWSGTAAEHAEMVATLAAAGVTTPGALRTLLKTAEPALPPPAYMKRG
jgi:hypothetical protein